MAKGMAWGCEQPCQDWGSRSSPKTNSKMKMPTMYKAFAFVAALIFMSCGNEAPEAAGQADKTGQPTESVTADAPASSNIDQTTGEARPAFNDAEVQAMMFNLLKGKWQSPNNPGQVVEFVDNKIRRIVGGNVASEASITIDGKCQNSICGKEVGWCFVEKSAAGEQCNVVLQCDMRNLHFRAIGSTAGDQVYNKMEEPKQK